ncbi:MAG: antibiotic resistance protein MarC [Cyanobacteria bacterium QS_8_64_29]|nr:MAG: antibiotic resistance protein MarC [Cyanobacteria bacterium QS_8_64_29]
MAQSQPFWQFLLGSLVALFPIVDPIGSIPFFLALTLEVPRPERDHLSRKVALYVVAILLAFLLIGGGILRFFGISLDVVKIAGGIVIFNSAWRSMESQPRLSREDNQAAARKSEQSGDIAFMPMTVPLLAGPGAIAVTLGISAQAGRALTAEAALKLLAAALAIAAMGGITYLCLRSASFWVRVLGETGIRALTRILGLFILAIGVQLILDGLGSWLTDLSLAAAP